MSDVEGIAGVFANIRAEAKADAAARLKPTAALLRQIEYTACPIDELNAVIQEEMESNPYLVSLDGLTPEMRKSKKLTMLYDTYTLFKQVFPVGSAGRSSRNHRSWLFAPRRSADAFEENKHMEPSMVDRPYGSARSLKDYLLEQVNQSRINEEVRVAITLLIEQLNEFGHLPDTLEKIAEDYRIPFDLLQEAQTFLTTFDPTGVGSRSLSELITVQLRDAGEVDENVFRVAERMDALLTETCDGHELKNRLKGDLEISSDDLNDALCSILKYCRFDLGAQFDDHQTAFAPDYSVVSEVRVVFDENGEPKVILQCDALPHVAFIEPDDPDLSRQFLSPVKALAQVIDNRRKFLFGIAEVIVRVQADHIKDRTKPLRHLTQRMVRDETKFSLATVHRFVSTHTIEIDGKATALSSMTNRKPVGTQKGRPVSPSELRWLLRKQWQAEKTPEDVMSDYDLSSHWLNAEGYEIEPRNICGHRKKIDMPNVYKRKRVLRERRR